jgi:hypothetical protein
MMAASRESALRLVAIHNQAQGFSTALAPGSETMPCQM